MIQPGELLVTEFIFNPWILLCALRVDDMGYLIDNHF